MSLRDTIIRGMARTLWVIAWSDEIEERADDGDEAARVVFRSTQGTDLMDVAPPTPAAADTLAGTLSRIIEDASPCSLEDALAAALFADLRVERKFTADSTDVGVYADLFGHYLVTESLGHGVTWSDDREDHTLNLPTYFDNSNLRSEVKP